MLAIGGFIVLSCFIRPLYLMWNVFSYHSGFTQRFSFLYMFWLVIVCSLSFEKMKDTDWAFIFRFGVVYAVGIWFYFSHPELHRIHAVLIR